MKRMKKSKKNIMREIRCPDCGSKRFKQEIAEIYNRYLNELGEISGYESDLTHDIELVGPFRCIECGRDCDDIFENVEIEV